MAEFFWVGQGYTAGIGRFDFNTPENWYVASDKQGKKYWKKCGYMEGPGATPTIPNSTQDWRGSDQIYFGTWNHTLDPYTASTVGSYGPGGLPPVKSPCLFGGYSGNANAGSWAGSTGGAGATYTSAASAIYANMGTPNTPNFPYTMNRPCLYPYHYLGCGITGEVYDWLLGPNGDGVGAYAPQDLLLTTGLSGGVAFVGGTAQRAFQVPKLKVTYDIQMAWYPGCSAQVDYEVVKAYQGNLSTGSPTSLVVGTKMTTYVAGEGKNTAFNGNASTLMGTMTVRNAVLAKITNNGLVGLDMQGVTCGEAYLFPTRTFVSPSSRFSSVRVNSGNYCGPIHFGGSVDTKTVIPELGITGGLSGGANDSTITVEYGSKLNGVFENDPGTPTFLFGAYGSSSLISTAQKIQFIGADWAASTTGSVSWNCLFAGGASAGVVETNNTVVAAAESIDNTNLVRIGTLGMYNNSVLDFARNANFNNWYLGNVTGSASNSTLIGGVVFRDETATIKGSMGLRLFNTQVVLEGRFDKRTRVVTETSASSIKAQVDY